MNLDELPMTDIFLLGTIALETVLLRLSRIEEEDPPRIQNVAVGDRDNGGATTVTKWGTLPETARWRRQETPDHCRPLQVAPASRPLARE